MKLSDYHFRTFEEQGFVVIENFYPEEKRARIATAIRKDLPPWEEVKDAPPEGGLLKDDFPYSQMLFNELIVDPDLISFVRRALETDDIHFRYAHNWARYPSSSAPMPKLHIDHGNNSLLPPCDDKSYGQISTWYFPEKVEEDEAPMLVIPKPYGRDVTKKVSLAVEAGSQMIFNTYLWHSATKFRSEAGQRYSVTRIYGRADHYWEGVGYITHLGLNEDFRKFIGRLRLDAETVQIGDGVFQRHIGLNPAPLPGDLKELKTQRFQLVGGKQTAYKQVSIALHSLAEFRSVIDYVG